MGIERLFNGGTKKAMKIILATGIIVPGIMILANYKLNDKLYIDTKGNIEHVRPTGPFSNTRVKIKNNEITIDENSILPLISLRYVGECNDGELILKDFYNTMAISSNKTFEEAKSFFIKEVKPYTNCKK